MRQQIPDRDVAADVLVAHLEVGQVLPHRRLEIDLPCSTSRIIIVAAKVFEIEAIGKTVCCVTGSGVVDVGHAEPAGGHHAVVEDADGDARAR